MSFSITYTIMSCNDFCFSQKISIQAINYWILKLTTFSKFFFNTAALKKYKLCLRWIIKKKKAKSVPLLHWYFLQVPNLRRSRKVVALGMWGTSSSHFKCKSQTEEKIARNHADITKFRSSRATGLAKTSINVVLLNTSNEIKNDRRLKLFLNLFEWVLIIVNRTSKFRICANNRAIFNW